MEVKIKQFMVILLKIEIINVWYYKTMNTKTSNDRNTVVSFRCLKYDINVIVVITAQFDPGTYSLQITTVTVCVFVQVDY